MSSEFDKHLKKAGGHIGQNFGNNKDEDNSPKTRNDKNHQASSQKFRQLQYFALSNTQKKAAFRRRLFTITHKNTS